MQKLKQNIFTEFGIDFDNNKFGLGYSTEVELEDGSEYRTKSFVKMKLTGCYFRLWILKKVLFLSGNGIEIVSKKRNNFKMVFGFRGINEQLRRRKDV